MDRLDDDALAGALLHEVEHARALDPLRYLLASVSLSLNPLARLLRPELAHWRLAREAACDHRAVQAGGDPLALAQAIVSAARQPRRGGPAGAVAALSRALGSGCDAVKVRVQLLMGYASHGAGHHAGMPPRPALHRSSLGMPFFLGLLLLLMLPHATGTALLDAMHQGIETAVLGFALD